MLEILGHLKNINFLFETNGKLMALGVPILKHFRVGLSPGTPMPLVFVISLVFSAFSTFQSCSSRASDIIRSRKIHILKRVGKRRHTFLTPTCSEPFLSAAIHLTNVNSLVIEVFSASN